MDHIVEARGLIKHFRHDAVVRGIDFTIAPGQCFGFLGPNGAGKTTTLRMILGLSPMDAGSLSVFGLPMPGSGKIARARMGVVPQLDNLDPDFTVVENLRIYASYFSIARTILEPRITELLAFVGLQDRAHSKIGSLSGGMQRRLTVARALVNDPELVVLDEPTTGLDPQARHMIWARLRDLTRTGKTLILTSHYMEEAERLCDELVIMDQGSIIARGAPGTLIEHQIEREVLEIRAGGHKIEKLLAGIDACRTDSAGDTVYCYTEDARPVIERLEEVPDVVFLQRPRNLEDVFLKLTGRELRD